jgi:hypothetical protein
MIVIDLIHSEKVAAQSLTRPRFNLSPRQNHARKFTAGQTEAGVEKSAGAGDRSA